MEIIFKFFTREEKKNLLHIEICFVNIQEHSFSFLKETFVSQYDIREFSLIQEKTNLDSSFDDNPDIEFESVDKIVMEQIQSIESEAFDTKLLLSIFDNL